MILTEKLIAFEKTKILVIGDIILDIYLHGKVERISPEAPIPILNHTHTHHALGGAANVAANLKGLGADITLISICGEDTEAEYLQTMLELDGIAYKLVHLKDRHTSSKTRVIASSQQMIRIDHETTRDISKINEELVFSNLENIFHEETPMAIVLEDYNKGLLTKSLISKILELAVTKGISVIVDPKKSNFFSYIGCTVFKPNLKECAAQLPFEILPELESLVKADQYLRERLHFKILMITLAEHGMFISDGVDQQLIPTEIKQISDVSGAGDTVTAIATFGWLQSLSISEIAILANQAAGFVCGIPGVHAIQREELTKFNI